MLHWGEIIENQINTCYTFVFQRKSIPKLQNLLNNSIEISAKSRVDLDGRKHTECERECLHVVYVSNLALTALNPF